MSSAEEFYEHIFNATAQGVFQSTPAGRYLRVNAAMAKIYGYDSPEDMIQSVKNIARQIYVDPKDRARFKKILDEAGAVEHFESRNRRKDGTIIWTSADARAVRDASGKVVYYAGFVRDITGLKEAEKTWGETEIRYRALVEHIPAIVYLDAADGSDRTLYISPQVEAILGFTPEEWIANPTLWEKHIHPDDRQGVLEKDARTDKSGEPFSEEYRMIARDGRVVWIQEESSLVRDSEGKPLYWQGFMLDVTGRKEAQEALVKAAEAYHGLFDSVTDAIYIQDREGRFLDVNLGAVKMYGYPREFFIGKTPEVLSAPGKNDLAAIGQAIGRAFEGVPQQFEFWGLRSNGEAFPKDVRLYKGMYSGQDVIFAIARDITEQRKAHEARERQLKELSILYELAVEGTRAADEDALIKKATEILSRSLYSDTLGFLLLDEEGKTFHPHPSYRGITIPDKAHTYPVGKGVAGTVAASGKPWNVRDVRKIKNYIQVNKNTRSELCVPMTIGGRVIGVINAESSKVGFFTEDDERLMMTIAGQLATAIERLRSERAEREQRMLAEALRDIASALNSTLEFEKVMDRILENIGRVVPSMSASIMLIENNIARPIRHRGFAERGLGEWFEALQLDCQAIPNLKRAVETGRPQLIVDTDQDPEWVRLPETAWIKSYVVAPIRTTTEIIGFISLDHDQPGFFTPRDAEKLLAFANQAASAIENARLFQEETRRAKIIEALAEIANLIATTRDTGRVLEEIAQRSLALLKARNIAIYLLQDDEKTLKIVAAKGTYQDRLLAHTIRLGEGITGNIVETGKAEIINDTARDPRRVHIPGTAEDDNLFETMMSAPLILREKPIGAINAWRLRANGLFTETELNFLTGIAQQVSIAIESGRLFQELERRAQEAAAIAEVGRGISSTLNLNLVLERIAAYARDLLRTETSAVYLIEENPAEMRAIAAFGSDAEQIKNDPLQLGSGILGHIALQKRGEIVNNANSDPRAITIKGTETVPFEHIMGVPILLKQQLTGLLAVWRIGAGQEFKPAELNFLDSLAQQAAIAIENARLFHAEQRRRQEAETLREAAAVVAATLDRERAIELILDQLARVLQYDSASIQLLRDGYLEIVGGRGWPSASAVLGLRFPIPGDNPNTIVVKERKAVVLESAQKDYELFRHEPHTHIRSWLGIPLIAHGEVIGMLSVDSVEEGHFNEEHLRLVAAFANQAAIAIDNAQLHEKSERQVRRLTALRDVDAAIASSLDLRVTLNILLDHAASQLRADAMAVLVYNPNLQILETAASLGFSNDLERRQIRIGEEPAGQIAITREPLQIDNLTESAEYAALPWVREEGFIAYLGHPLIGKGQLKGVFETFFRAPFLPDHDWLDFMRTMAGQAAIAIDNAQMFENLQRSHQELTLAYDTTLEGWGRALELRDKETQGHTRRVADLTVRLARRLNINDNKITHIRRGVLLHDIGKMGIPDHILRKTGPLNAAEWELMRQHPQYAYDLLYPIAYLRPALDIPLCHHEKWDGSGYPRGLKGEDIPLSARIFAVVDVWDALLSDRPYRKSWTKEQAMEYLRREAGSRFDPKIVEAFLDMIAEET